MSESELGTIRERDIDFLLQEEFRCSSSFRKGFLDLIHESGFLAIWDEASATTATLSFSADCGETDILVKFTGSSGNAVLFIENKIDACFQESQAQRYILRKEKILRDKEADAALTVLIAPEKYFGREDCELFDMSVSYEQLTSILKQGLGKERSPGLRLRLQHRIDVLNKAIEYSRTGYTPSNDEKNLGFRSGYYEACRRLAPTLQMQDPFNRSEGGFQHFASSLFKVVGTNDRIIHKLERGVVHLQITGWGKYEHVAPYHLEPLLGEGMTVIRTTKSLSLQLSVPPLDHRKPFAPQTEDAEIGILAALRLQDWWKENSGEIRRIDKVLKDEFGD